MIESEEKLLNNHTNAQAATLCPHYGLLSLLPFSLLSLSLFVVFIEMSIVDPPHWIRVHEKCHILMCVTHFGPINGETQHQKNSALKWYSREIQHLSLSPAMIASNNQWWKWFWMRPNWNRIGFTHRCVTNLSTVCVCVVVQLLFIITNYSKHDYISKCQSIIHRS